MNQRILVLAQQAKLHSVLMLYHWKSVGALTDIEQQELENIEKFAESLIREAAQFVSGSAEVYTQAEQDACVRAAIGLKKYFGIEE